MKILDIETLETWKTAAWASDGIRMSRSTSCAQAILIILVRRQANATPEETPVATLKAQDLLPCEEVDLNDAIISNYRRKFRSETSDNMDSWKAEVKRVRREKIRRKKR